MNKNHCFRWSEDYNTRIERNIGLVSYEEQEILKTSKIAILGTGGVGAPMALNLAYAGIENFVLADFDKVEFSNLNRQPYTEADVGKLKVEALSEKLIAVNSNIQIQNYTKITDKNIQDILKQVNVVVLSLDGPVGSIIVSRKAREMKIPLVEGWATPIVFARWFTPDSLDYESTYGLNLADKSVQDITKSSGIQSQIRGAFIKFFLSLPGIEKEYENEPGFKKAMLRSEIGLRSFAPTVWAVSIFLSHEVIFAGLLKRKKRTLAPEVHGFDYMHMKEIHKFRDL